jgi:hypothetical protein
MVMKEHVASIFRIKELSQAGSEHESVRKQSSACCLPIFLYLNTVIIFGEEYT